MCGICGLAATDSTGVSLDVLRRMTDAMAHRGPHGHGTFVHEGVGLGHRRLSIIDLEGGRQPLTNEDGTVVTVFNGEIYNYAELRRDLQARGHVLATQSDTETLVHLYEDYGLEMLDRLRGMFAFAIYDLRRRELFLVRDRFGMKPLYYAERNGTLYFASEIKPLLTAGVSVEVNPTAVDQYTQFRFGYGDETIFRGIYRLPAATILHWRDGRQTLRRYYDPSRSRTVAALPTSFDEAFSDAVSSHLVADVPVGAYLSGGVDSAAVVAEMVRHVSIPPQTFCVDFTLGHNEAAAAERTAELLGTNHHSVTCGIDELLQLPQAIRALEEPVGDAVVVAQFALSKATQAAGVRTVLTGDGADETLAGYPFQRALHTLLRYGRGLPSFVTATLGSRLVRYVPLWLIGRAVQLPFDVREAARARLSEVLRNLGRGDLRRLHDTLLAVHTSSDLAELYTSEFLASRIDDGSTFAGEPVGETLLNRILSMQFEKWLPANINLKQDKLCMAHSVENRVPFLDHVLVEYLRDLPDREKLRGRENKVLLRRWAAARLPATVSAAPKAPFHMPLDKYLQDRRVWDLVRENVSEDRIRRRGYYRPEYVRTQTEKARGGDFLAAKRLMAIVVLELWHRIFVDGETL